MPFINGRFYMNPAYGRAVEHARASEETSRRNNSDRQESDGHWVTIEGHHVPIQETSPERNAAGSAQKRKIPIHVSVMIAQDPQIVQNLRIGKDIVSGVGAQLKIKLSDDSGNPIAGASITERNKQGGVQNPDSIKTDSDGSIRDWIIKAGPAASMPGTSDDLRDYAKTHPITVTSTQTLSVDVDKASYEITWTRTLTNVNSGGKLNDKLNSHGINFTITWTNPQVKAVSR